MRSFLFFNRKGRKILIVNTLKSIFPRTTIAMIGDERSVPPNFFR